MSPESRRSDSALVHLAGPAIRAANVIRQRCAWCGALLDEKDLERVAWHDDGSGENPLIHEDGSPRDRWEGLVAVADGNPRAMWAVEQPEDGKIPAESCMSLDPAATT